MEPGGYDLDKGAETRLKQRKSLFGTENKKARIVVEADFVYMEFRRFCLVVSEI